jgi:hypothetical protein
MARGGLPPLATHISPEAFSKIFRAGVNGFKIFPPSLTKELDGLEFRSLKF